MLGRGGDERFFFGGGGGCQITQTDCKPEMKKKKSCCFRPHRDPDIILQTNCELRFWGGLGSNAVGPDPDCESGSGSRRVQMTQKNRKQFKNVIF
jgi:hypothetical protein